MKKSVPMTYTDREGNTYMIDISTIFRRDTRVYVYTITHKRINVYSFFGTTSKLYEDCLFYYPEYFI